MSRLYLYVALSLAALAVLSTFIYYQRSVGAANAIAKQEKANAQFRVRASKGAVDYDVCDSAGGLYDFRKGSCKLP